MTFWRRAVHAAGWVVLAPIVAFVALRVAAWDRLTALVALDAITPIVLVPAWLVGIAAGLLRHIALGAAALIVVVAQFVLVWPEMAAERGLPSAARTAPKLTLFDANVQATNRSIASYATEIRQAHPDLVVLEESIPAFVRSLDATGALIATPYRTQVERDDPFAFGIMSRFPLSNTATLSVDGRPVMVRTTIDTPAGPQTLYAIHTVAPIGGHRREWEDELSAVRDAVNHQTGRLLVVGDFNATWGNRGFRRLLSTGLSDAAAARGQPLAMTWPRDRRVVPAFVRLDHVLTRGGPVVTTIRTGLGRGSDHRPLVAVVALL